MNIYKFEVKMLKKSMLIWSLAVPGFLLFYMSFFPMIEADATGFQSMMESFPEEFLAFFGMNPDLPFTTIMGYLSLTFGMVQLPLAIQAANYGFHILSVEERELTADFLMTKPVSRNQILVSKVLASYTSLTLVNIILWITTISAVLLFKGDSSYDMTKVVVLLSSTIFFQSFFLGVGMVVSVILKKISSVLSFSMGLGFGLYILSSLGTLLSSKLLGFITPFSHFSPSYILVEGNYDWSVSWFSFVAIVLSFAGTYFFYNKRNIASL